MEKSLIEACRNKPLPDVLEALGAERDKSDRSNWKTAQGGRITIDKKNEVKWYDHHFGKGGGGAIDLMMHFKGCNFKEAVEELLHLPPRHANTTRKNPDAAEKVQPIPEPVEKNWPIVRKYLIEKRHLKADLVDNLHAHGSVFSDNFNNVCFLSQDKKGCELRGTGDTVFHGYRGEKSGFVLHAADGVTEVAFVESSIDAISFCQLGFKGTVIAYGGQAIKRCTEEAVRHHAEGKKIIAAFDNDKAGNAMSKQLLAAVPAAERKIPKGGAKDWNEYLQKKQAEKDKNKGISTTKADPVGFGM